MIIRGSQTRLSIEKEWRIILRKFQAHSVTTCAGKNQCYYVIVRPSDLIVLRHRCFCPSQSEPISQLHTKTLAKICIKMCGIEPLCDVEVTSMGLYPSVVLTPRFEPPASQITRRAKYYDLATCAPAHISLARIC